MITPDPQNDDLLILPEIACQAIVTPAVLALRGGTVELEVSEPLPESLTAALLNAEGQLRGRIEIGEDAALSPLFSSLPCTESANGNHLLKFSVIFPGKPGSNSVAAALHDWLARHGVRRALVNGAEVSSRSSPEEAIAAIVRVLKRESTVEPEQGG